MREREINVKREVQKRAHRENKEGDEWRKKMIGKERT